MPIGTVSISSNDVAYEEAMQRRGFLWTLGLAFLPLAGCIGGVRDQVDTSSGSHGPKKDFGLGSSGFASAGWTDEGMFEVEFEEDHGMEGWGIRYHAHEESRNNIVTEDAPDFAGTRTVDLFRAFGRYDSRPPTGEFHIIAYEGSFGPGINIIGEELGHVSYFIEPELVIKSAELTDDFELSIELENIGNSPCKVAEIDIQGERTSVGGMVHPDSTEDMISDRGIFPKYEDDEDCQKLLEEFTVSLITVPKMEVEIEMEEEFEHERHCVVRF